LRAHVDAWLIRPAHGGFFLLFFAALLLAASRLLIKEARGGWRLTETWNLLYQSATIAFNYVEFGFVRRGLSGTLIYLSGLPQVAGTVAFHLLSAACLAAAGCWLIRQSRQSAAVQAVHAGVLMVLMMCWGEDAGRTDMAVAALLAGSVLGLQARRPVLAALALITALAVHENGFIFGVPMLGVLLLTRRLPVQPKRGLTVALTLLAAVAMAYAFFDRFPRASNAEISAAIHSKLPNHLLVDWAIYYALGGVRGVSTSICQNLSNPNYPLFLVAGLLVIGTAIAALAGRKWSVWWPSLLAALPPFIFLYLAANDMARWTALACFNAWLVSIAAPAQPLPGRSRSWLLVHLGVVAVLLVLAHPRWPLKVAVPVYSPSPLIEALSIRLGGPVTPNVGVVIDRCDPGWRSVLDQR
jgi:hypothetical protein